MIEGPVSASCAVVLDRPSSVFLTAAASAAAEIAFCGSSSGSVSVALCTLPVLPCALLSGSDLGCQTDAVARLHE